MGRLALAIQASAALSWWILFSPFSRIMTYKAEIKITLRPSILDPQGKATHHAMKTLEIGNVEQVRMGKFVEMWIEAGSEEAARQVASTAAEKLLANPVMEDFAVTVSAVAEARA